jgi:uncharacterized protein YbjT (DUF2867 family)
MTIAITGGTGFVGQALIEQALGAGMPSGAGPRAASRSGGESGCAAIWPTGRRWRGWSRARKR